MRKNLYRFVFVEGKRNSDHRLVVDAGLRPRPGIASTASSSNTPSTSSEAPKGVSPTREISLIEFSVPKGDVEILEGDVTIQTRQEDEVKENTRQQNEDSQLQNDIRIQSLYSSNFFAASSSSSSPRSMDELSQFTAEFSPSHSHSSSDKQKAKLRCFRSIFDDDDINNNGRFGSRREASSGAFPFMSILLRYLLSVSNNGRPFFTCQMMDATLATFVSPVVTEPVLGSFVCAFCFSCLT